MPTFLTIGHNDLLRCPISGHSYETRAGHDAAMVGGAPPTPHRCPLLASTAVPFTVPYAVPSVPYFRLARSIAVPYP